MRGRHSGHEQILTGHCEIPEIRSAGGGWFDVVRGEGLDAEFR